MATYRINITASSVFSSEAPELQLFSDGVLQSVSLVDEVTGSGSNSYSYLVDFGSTAPSDVYLRFSDANTEANRSITIENVQINGVDITSSTFTLQNGSSLDGNGHVVLEDEEDVAINIPAVQYAFAYTVPTIGDFASATHIATNQAGETITATYGDDVIVGGNGQDNITGYSGDDVIFGGAGNDTLSAQKGNDKIIGGDGLDTILGGEGDDLIYGEDGNDTIYGEEDNDTINGGAGVDFIKGGTGHDIIIGGTEGDRLYGEDGDDTIDGEWGNDRLFGGLGNDTLHGGAGHDELYGEDGDDTIYGGDNNDKLVGGAGNDILHGEAGVDKLYGHDGNDTIYGGDGGDRLDGDAGDDILNGDAGNDKIYGGIGNDTIDGGADDDQIWGEDGNDTIDGGAGADRIVGGTGEDILNGGADNDVLYGNDDNDTLNGGDGDDVLYGQNGFDTLDGGLGDDKLYGGGGNDTIYGGEGNDTLNGSINQDTLYGGAGNDLLIGGTGYDTLNGGDGDDRLEGNEDDDVLNGDAGADKLYGGTGNDTLNGGADNDQLWGEDGDDIIDGGDGDDRVVGNAGDDTLSGGNGDDLLLGYEDNDTLHGGAGADRLGGGDGNDILNGDDGNDELYGNDGDDILNGGAGNDHLKGHAGIDTLNGGDGDDILLFDVDDIFNGGTGTDTITISENDNADINFGSGNFSGIDVIKLDNYNGASAVNNLQISMADIAANTDSNSIIITGDVGLDQINFSLTGSETRNADVNIDGIDYAEFALGGTTAYIQLGVIYNGSVLTAFGGGGGGGSTPTTGDDTLVGTSGNDTIDALAGNDIVIGDDGNDILNGNDGDDNVYGGAGNDTLNGGDGDDILHASLAGTITPSISSNTIEANNPGVFYNADTGNFYQFVSASVTHAGASSAASATLLNGVAGHLATITSTAENGFIQSLTGTNFAWIDGTDSGTEGTFIWTEGPDAGTQFWNDVGNYNNFYQGTPTTNTDARDNVLFLGDNYSGTWYAWTGDYETNYLIEWEGNDVLQETIVGFDSRNETNYLNGGAGNDELYGSMGKDVLVGGTGSDILEGGAGNDKLYAAGLSEAEIQAILTANPSVSYSEATGNFYQYVNTDSNYADAIAGVASTTLNGVTGHLATITSAEENVFLVGLTGTDWAWMGGSDAAVEGTFSWDVGPDSGTEIGNGSYANWYPSALAQNTDANDHLTFLGQNYNGQWYIFEDNRTLDGYIIEWEASDFVTDTSANFLSGGLGADELYGSDGIDSFIFENVSAFTSVDTIHGFDSTDSDVLDISDIVNGLGINAANIVNYVSVDQTTGVHVDVTGTGTFDSTTQIAAFQGAASVDDALTMLNDGTLLV